MKIFKELNKLGYKHYTEHTIEELDNLPLNSEERIMEQALVLRWFREKHAMHHGIGFNGSWYYDIDSMKNCNEAVYEVAHKWDMKTYEEAEQACLDKLIEIIKNK